MSLSDRIAVMFDGRIMGERRPDETSAASSPPDGRDHGTGRLMARAQGEA
jgi:hypothetical protein